MQNHDDRAKLLERLKELEKVGRAPGKAGAQTRGRDFEVLMLDLFAQHNLLLRRSFHTADDKSEQIDGAIEIAGRVALVEAKWVESGIAASELFAFLGKVEGKFVGTIGVFISYEELSNNFIGALRAGRRQSVLVIHGTDVAQLFESNFPLPDYLKASLHHVSIDNAPHLPVSKFSASRKVADHAKAVLDDNKFTNLLNQLRMPSTSVKAIVAAKQNATDELLENLSYLMDIFPKAEELGGSASTKISQYITEAVQYLPQSESAVDVKYWDEIFASTILDSSYESIHAAMAERFPASPVPRKNSTEDALLAAWRDTDSNYENENILANVTKPFWKHLSSPAKQQLLRMFVVFSISNRRPNYPQMSLARAAISDESNKCELDAALLEVVQAEFKTRDTPDADLTWRKKWTLRSLEKVGELVGREKLNEIVDSVSSASAK